ncbi:MAG: hypothetical protein Q8O45_09945 [Desulfurivibrionaceae bacterium]|nr:hypothetical protein [Desulfurivibrionaceae bacterium]
MILQKTLLTFLLLPAFLFSDNAMLFGKHVVEDVSHVTECATSTADGSLASSLAGTGHHGEQKGEECCDTTHSHALTPCHSVVLSYLPKLTSPFEAKPFLHFPKVFLDLIIPPPNLA